MAEADDYSRADFPPVTRAESGQKLLQFLERRLNLPQSLLHRWVRTGQIRLNGKRCKPFERVEEGSQVRLPPFAGKLARQADDAGETDLDPALVLQRDCGLTLLDHQNDIWAIHKPYGLPTQPGSGHTDSVATRLGAAFQNSFFHPVPAHRLDRDTTGVLLAGATFEALRQLQDFFREGGAVKEYLAWVKGFWPHREDVLLRHFLRKEGPPGHARMRALPQVAPYAREALSVARFLRAGNGGSLLHIRLLTGRTHQIRAQLSALGYPLAGDAKYGEGGGPMFLHCLRVSLPGDLVFTRLPDWEQELMPNGLPTPFDNKDFSGLKVLDAIAREASSPYKANRKAKHD